MVNSWLLASNEDDDGDDLVSQYSEWTVRIVAPQIWIACTEYMGGWSDPSLLT